MLADRIEGKWIDAFCEIFEKCAVKPGRYRRDPVGDAVAPAQRAARGARIAAPRRPAVSYRRADPAQPASGAGALDRRERGDRPACAGGARRSAGCGFVVDCTLEGLMHAPETPDILQAPARASW